MACGCRLHAGRVPCMVADVAARKVVYPGSFDPVTNGHLDVIERACGLFDEIIVGVAADSSKKYLFPVAEREAMVREAVEAAGFPAKVMSFSGLQVEFVASTGAKAVIRGLRAISDFEFEFQLALMNRKLSAHVETIFLMPRDQYIFLSSSIVKEIARLGGPIKDFVPAGVEKALRERFQP